MTQPAKIKMYMKAWCGYCAAAKNLLKSKAVEFETIDVGADRDQLQQMIDLSGRRTVPQIFVNDKHIGGYDDIAELEANGELDNLLGRSQATD